MVPLDIAQEFVRSCSGTDLSLEEDAPSHYLGPAGPCAPPVAVARQLSGIQDLPQGNLFRKCAPASTCLVSVRLGWASAGRLMVSCPCCPGRVVELLCLITLQGTETSSPL